MRAALVPFVQGFPGFWQAAPAYLEQVKSSLHFSGERLLFLSCHYLLIFSLIALVLLRVCLAPLVRAAPVLLVQAVLVRLLTISWMI
ncbi:hypothetical protein BKA61DRAFT_625936 [Leptodontidium sp. MPI-SDFR-AT-0119]|nr:hypothetical protein BKA61DRAFT_625936 [Leptodontidium sp. MPI-SDFR-AT-0119]